MKRVGRRALLRALGGAAASLPILRSPVLAQGAAQRVKRLILMFSPNGAVLDQDDAWTPTGGETDFQLRRVLEPLAPHRQHLLILSGLNMSPGTGLGDPHQKGMGMLWTAAELLPGDFKLGAGWAGGISVDQVIAPHVQGSARYRSVELGVRCEDFRDKNVWTRMCYAGPGRPLDPIQDPVLAYRDLLGSAQPPPRDLASERRAYLRNRSLEAAVGQFARMKDYLGAEDARRIELHLDSVRDIQRELQAIAAPGAPACATFQVPSLNLRAHASFPQLVSLQMRILVEAMACDQVRVGSLQLNQAVGYLTPDFVMLDGRPIGKPHHELSHWRGGDISDPYILANPLWAKRATAEIHRFYAQQFATLVGLLAERDLLSSTVAVWGNELGDGDQHSLRNVPFVLAGSAGGYFRTGRFLRYQTAPGHGGLLLALCQAMGAPATAIGKYQGPVLSRLSG